MKKMLVAFALALALAPVASTYVSHSTVYAATAAAEERPRICFIFGPWKYCI